jgi:hypothetical protein
VKAHRVVRHRGSHIFSRQLAHRWRWGCEPYAPAALYRPGRFGVLISVRGSVYTRATVRLELLGTLKNLMPHRESNPRASGLSHSASTNYATACPVNVPVCVLMFFVTYIVLIIIYVQDNSQKRFITASTSSYSRAWHNSRYFHFHCPQVFCFYVVPHLRNVSEGQINYVFSRFL